MVGRACAAQARGCGRWWARVRTELLPTPAGAYMEREKTCEAV